MESTGGVEKASTIASLGYRELDRNHEPARPVFSREFLPGWRYLFRVFRFSSTEPGD
jgi:hypothetical protein